MRPVLASERDHKRKAFSTSRKFVDVDIWRDVDNPADNADDGGFVVSTGITGKRKAFTAPARFWQNTLSQGKETQLGDQEVGVTTWTFRFLQPDAPNLYVDDEIHLNGRTWQVTSPGGDSSSEIYIDALAVEITPGAVANPSSP